MGDTATSVNQGGASGSTGIQHGGKQMRMRGRGSAPRAGRDGGGEARRAGRAAHRHRRRRARARRHDRKQGVSYAELIGGRYFNVQLEWNKQIGNALYAPGKAKPKDPKDYKIVGKPIPRDDIAPKVYAQEDFVTDIKRARHGACAA